MIEVHAPHERIHGFRDFLLHLLTITIGLLIALGLEGLVELRQHHNLRAEADENIKREIEDNRKELAFVRGSLGKERENLLQILSYMQARSQNRPYKGHDFQVLYHIGNFKSASWSTASATGAASYMDYAHVQKFAEAYEMQSDFAALQRQTLANVLETQAFFVGAFDPDTFPVADAELAKGEVRRALSHFVAIDQIGASLDSAYANALK